MSDNISRTITPNPPADFTPSMGNYQTLQPFRYWCQKVLPLVYDDSLSYYELLCKVVDYLNKTMEDVETLHGDVTNLHTAYVKLQEYVNNYFSSLDVQEEINNKLDAMAKDGSLTELIRKYVDPFIDAQNNKISVLESRMDTFTRLPNGSTTGDAELTDIRVPASGFNNGEPYPTAGDAVRGQVDVLNVGYVGNGVFPIKKFGAIGNGVTDDYTAFQTAINNKSVKEITLEPKTYLIKHTLRITDRDAIKITGNGATIKFEAGDAVNLNDYCFESANMTGVIIENCTFDGGYEWIDRPIHTADGYQEYLDKRAKARHAFRLTNCTQFNIINVTVKNTLAGFWLTGCTYGNLTNCKSLNTLADSVFLVGSHNISVCNHYSDNIDDDSYVSINYSTDSANYCNSFDNCYTKKGFGALCCFYGSYSAIIRNSRIDACSYTPLKLGVHNPYRIAGLSQIVENCTIKLTENIDNYTNNELNICEGISRDERASNIILKNVSLIFAKTDGYTIRFVNTDNISITNLNCECNFVMTNCSNVNIENSTLTTVTLSNVLRVPIRSTNLTSISTINVSRLIALGNTITGTPAFTFNGNNNLCTIDNNNIKNNGNNHFLMTTSSLLPAGSPHLAFLIGTVLHSGGNLIYVTNTGFKILSTD